METAIAYSKRELEIFFDLSLIPSTLLSLDQNLENYIKTLIETGFIDTAAYIRCSSSKSSDIKYENPKHFIKKGFVLTREKAEKLMGNKTLRIFDKKASKSFSEILNQPSAYNICFLLNDTSILILGRDGKTFNDKNLDALNKVTQNLGTCLDTIISLEENKVNEVLIERQNEALTEKNKELERYINLNLELEKFTYIASHDLKSPIRTILSFSNLLEEKAREKLDPKELSFLNIIQNSSEKMINLIDDLLVYSRIDQEKVEKSSFNLKLMIEAVIGELEEINNSKTLDIKVGDMPHFIEGNSKNIKLLFYHLIDNAIKFSSGKDPIAIYIRGNDNEETWDFEITDKGIGIESKYHQKVFGMFQKLKPDPQNLSSGMGLSICQKIVQQHKGKIWVASEINDGTSVFFQLSKS